MADDCAIKVKEAAKELFGEVEIPESTIKRITKDIEGLKAASEKFPGGGSFEARVAEYIRQERLDAEFNVRSMAIEMRKMRARDSFYSQKSFGAKPEEAFIGKLDSITTLAKGGRDSLTARQSALMESYHELVFSGLEEKGMTKLFTEGVLDKEVRMAYDAQIKGTEPHPSIPLEAKEIASTLARYNKLILNDERAAGAPVRNLEDRIASQTHNPDAIREAGFDRWFQKTLPLVDQKRSFSLDIQGDAKAVKRVMKSYYDDMVAGVFGQEGSLSNKLARERSLHFLDGESAHNYNLEFGKGNLAETVRSEIMRKSKSIALLETFGEKPREAIQVDIERRIAALQEAGDKAGAERLTRYTGRIMQVFDQVNNTNYTPGNNTLAQVGSFVRSIQVVSKMANTGIRSFSNSAIAAVELTNATGENVMHIQAKLAKEFVAQLPAAGRATYLSQMEKFVGDSQAALHQQMGLDYAQGIGNRLGRWMMKINLMDVINRTTKQAMAIMMQEHLAENAGKAFGDLHPQMQAHLLEGGFTKEDWGLLSKAVEKSEESGRSFITPEAIRNLPEADVRAVMAAKGVKGMSPENYARKLELQFRGSLIQIGNVGSTTAGVREGSALIGGSKAGTIQGELLRTWAQFKSFYMQSWNIGKKFANSTPDFAALSEGELRSQGMSKRDMGMLAYYIVGTTAAAYAADTAIRMMNGKAPKSPKDVSTWVDALGKSGGGAMYADMLTGEWNKYSAAEAALGPTFGQVAGTGLKVISEARQQVEGGNTPLSKKVLSQTTHLVRNNIPFQQMPLMKQGLDYLQYDVINETLNPGSRAKYELKRAREQAKGQ